MSKHLAQFLAHGKSLQCVQASQAPRAGVAAMEPALELRSYRGSQGQEGTLAWFKCAVLCA